MPGQLSQAVILEYCGGAHTDWLYESLSAWNPGHSISVLDNASPVNRSKYITHGNQVNSYIGGGICDCIRLAQSAGCRYLFLIMNDIAPVTPIHIDSFERLMEECRALVQVGAAVTPVSDKASVFPWMVERPPGGQPRLVPHCDFLCCLLRLEFISSFGGFPESRGGWGYDVELAYHAHLEQRQIAILDTAVIAHSGDRSRSFQALGPAFDKNQEMCRVYQPRYGDFQELMNRTWTETLRHYDAVTGRYTGAGR